MHPKLASMFTVLIRLSERKGTSEAGCSLSIIHLDLARRHPLAVFD